MRKTTRHNVPFNVPIDKIDKTIIQSMATRLYDDMRTYYSAAGKITIKLKDYPAIIRMNIEIEPQCNSNNV